MNLSNRYQNDQAAYPGYFYLCIILVLLAAVVLTAAACGSLSRTDEVKAKAFPSGRVLTLPLEAKLDAKWLSGDYVNSDVAVFEAKSNYPDICQKIAELPDVTLETAEFSSAQALVISRTAGQAPDLFAFRLGSEPHRFTLGPATVQFRFDPETKITTLFPIHLFSDPRIRNQTAAVIHLDTEYEITFSDESFKWEDVRDQFRAFYDRSEMYQTRTDQNTLLLTLKPGVEARNMSITFSQQLDTVFVKTSLQD